MRRAPIAVAALSALAFLGVALQIRVGAASATRGRGAAALPAGVAVDRRPPPAPLLDARLAGRTCCAAFRGRWPVLRRRRASACEPAAKSRALLRRGRMLRAAGRGAGWPSPSSSVEPWRDSPRGCAPTAASRSASQLTGRPRPA